MDKEAWWAIVHWVTKSQTQLSDWTHSQGQTTGTIDKSLKNKTSLIRSNRRYQTLEEESHLLRVHCAAWVSVGRMQRDKESALADTSRDGKSPLWLKWDGSKSPPRHTLRTESMGTVKDWCREPFREQVYDVGSVPAQSIISTHQALLMADQHIVNAENISVKYMSEPPSFQPRPFILPMRK